MPLSPGSSRAVVSSNIKEMMASGYPQKQAVAASLSNARRHPSHSGGAVKYADGGSTDDYGDPPGGSSIAGPPGNSARFSPFMPSLPDRSKDAWPAADDPRVGRVQSSPQRSPTADSSSGLSTYLAQVYGGLASSPGHRAAGGPAHMDMGGMPTSADSPWWERTSAREIEHPGGFINSGIAGRTDRLPIATASESHVLPSDVVSGLGQGSSLAGAHLLNAALRMGPWGTELPRGRGGHGPPAPPRMSMGHAYARGGHGKSSILAAGGEFIVPPEVVLRIGRGDLKKGHELLDRMIERVRAHTIKYLKKAPAPKK